MTDDVKSGQQIDFDYVYATFQPKIRRYLARRAGEADADDLTQAVFIRVSQALQHFRGESSLATWIYRIAANVVTDHVRSPSFRDHRLESPAEEIGIPTTESPDLWTGEVPAAIDQYLVRKEMSACIRGVVENLPQQSCSVIKLSAFEGLKNGEIAERLGTSLETVKIRLHRARIRLRDDLSSQCHLYLDDRNELACDPKQCH